MLLQMILSSADSSQDKNTPAVVSLISGGIAGGVEGFMTVRRALSPSRYVLTFCLVSCGVRKDKSATES